MSDKKRSYKVIVYGIDRYTEIVLSSIKETNQIIGISDSFSCLLFYGKYKFYKCTDLIDLDFDYVIVTSRDRKNHDDIIKFLHEIGISKNKIVSFFEIFHEEKIDKVFKCLKTIQHEGVILGLSHAAKGINPKYLDGEWLNLATSAEDIYYHFEVLKKYYNRYVLDANKVKYVVIDMYDYTVFSFDTSMSAQALCYWADGGNSSLHNYSCNTLFTGDVEKDMIDNLPDYPAYFPKRKNSELILRKRLFEEKIAFEKINKCFADVDPSHLGFEDFPNEFQNSGHINKNPLIPASIYARLDKSRKKYEKTEAENKKIFLNMINYTKAKLPLAKIILIMLPRYGLLEELHNNNIYIMEQKNEFEEFVSQFVDNDKVFFLNYKNNTEIANNNFLWRDVSHLNYQGSVAMTSLLNNDLRKLEDKSK